MRLRRVVLGYQDASSDFKFDLSLNYRLSGVIHCYSDQKPTLVVRPLGLVVTYLYTLVLFMVSPSFPCSFVPHAKGPSKLQALW